MTLEVFHSIAKALADPQRFDILERIAAVRPMELPCKELARELPITQATISHHLKELSDARLIEGRRDGQCMNFRYMPETMSEYRAELQRRTQAKM